MRAGGRPIARQSKKRRQEARQRREVVAYILERDPICRKCQSRPTNDVHEIKNRSAGGNYLNPDECVGLCRPCHDWITTHPAAAHEEGWTRFSYERVESTSPRGDTPVIVLCFPWGKGEPYLVVCEECGRVGSTYNVDRGVQIRDLHVAEHAELVETTDEA